MALFTDQLGRSICLEHAPQRIISVVPSQTELLFHLGLEERVIGITKFCVHPEKWFREKQRIGGTKNLDIQTISSLKSDLIIANKEENVREQIEELADAFPIWVSDINDLADAYSMIRDVAALTGKSEEGQLLLEAIQTAFSQLQTKKPETKTAYLIWKEPYMAAGGDTFINNMLSKAGFQNVFEKANRYPIITSDDLASCEVVLLSSEPYPFKQKHVDELQQQLPNTKILLVDGEMFSWYGSRLRHAPPYFAQLQKQLDAIV